MYAQTLIRTGARVIKHAPSLRLNVFVHKVCKLRANMCRVWLRVYISQCCAMQNAGVALGFNLLINCSACVNVYVRVYVGVSNTLCKISAHASRRKRTGCMNQSASELSAWRRHRFIAATHVAARCRRNMYNIIYINCYTRVWHF